MADYEERFQALERELHDKVDELSRNLNQQMQDIRAELLDRNQSVEQASVNRDGLAAKLEHLAATIRDRSQ